MFFFIESIFIWFWLFTVNSLRNERDVHWLASYGLICHNLWDYLPIFLLSTAWEWTGKFHSQKSLSNLYPVKFNNYWKLMLIEPWTNSIEREKALGVLLYENARLSLDDCSRAESIQFRKSKFHVKTRKNFFFKKWSTGDLYRHFSLMLIFMSCSCMSLIYLLLIFRGIFSRFSLTSFLFVSFVCWVLRMLVC